MGGIILLQNEGEIKKREMGKRYFIPYIHQQRLIQG